MKKEITWPKKRGLFECVVDGKRMALVHHFCENNGKHWWTTTSGHDVVGCDIKWGKEITL